MERKRKVRSDKKVDVKPTLPIDIKYLLYDFCSLSEEYVKDVGEKLCMLGLDYRPAIDSLGPHLVRDYIFESTLMLGDEEREVMDTSIPGRTGKITIKFKRDDYDRLYDFAYALDITPTTVASLLIQFTLKDRKFMKQYLLQHVPHLDVFKMRHLRELLSL